MILQSESSLDDLGKCDFIIKIQYLFKFINDLQMITKMVNMFENLYIFISKKGRSSLLNFSDLGIKSMLCYYRHVGVPETTVESMNEPQKILGKRLFLTTPTARKFSCII